MFYIFKQMKRVNNFKNTVCFCVILLVLLNLSSCFKAPEPPPTPEPTQAPERSPTALPPSAKLPLTGDEVYVLERFSIALEHGSKGFKPGTKVKILKIDGDQFLVTDGKFEALKPSRFFTANKNEAESSAENLKKELDKAEGDRIAREKTKRDKDSKLEAQAEADRKEKAKKNYQAQIADLKLKIADLDRRISIAGDERVAKFYPRNGGSRHKYHDGRIVTLSKDASQIEILIKDQNQLKYRLEKLELNPPVD
jgi:hypothetical protein